ncbi:S8 family serine peptidase [Streptomyces sp. XM4011]|uniref:S8 family peptidase n=1 Tax=Streptomyces sp. XM4011 TaxID=2929780 RepID=UPI001FFA67C2|nr:S8 family serine peptidase [Streptomyces sp. XM4011]MCK1813896.1 S8 family serine peptidase [Streptomyces sp. XM4011]
MSKKYPRGLAAGAIAVALAAGLAAPAGAAPSDPGAPGAPTAAGPAGVHDLVLITGDRVLVDAEGAYRGFIPAEGRASIPVRTLTRDGETFVVPQDVRPLIDAGTLDERLFNITRLSADHYRARGGLPLIVTYGGTARSQDSAAARLAEATEDTAEDRTPLDSINGEAFTVTAEETAGLWDALTRSTAGGDAFALAAAPGIATVALDGTVRKSLAESVPQIGTHEVWEAGYDGEGVTIAVLDTGVSEEHADLAGGKVVAAEDFADSGHTGDRDGHGTHVASTAAGTGAHSGGTYTGVAPGADILNGKVLDDYGSGFESGIIAGMEWAVEQGADIINMSLGGSAGPAIDPMEEAVNRLSAESDALFVIAAGNSGPLPGSIGSPGTADAALTIGAVDKSDTLADFSSIGPRTRDGGLKPDVTGPGVDIAAAGAPDAAIWSYGEPVADGYVAISGTSMATPHAAGAAALLKQRHPDWTGQQLKAALTGSTTGGEGLTAYQQGSGRIDVAAAVEQTVIAETSSLGFGTVPFPHEDAEPVVRELTYRNLGDTDVTLDLALDTLGPEGGPAPEGVFTVAAEQLTVPAGGTASVEVTADTSRGTAYGAHSLYVTATGDDGRTVRTAGVIDREEEMFEVAVDARGLAGEPAALWDGHLVNLDTGEFRWLDAEEAGSVRVPGGRYLVDISIHEEDGLTWLMHPALTVDAAVTVDAHVADAGEIALTAPDPAATRQDQVLVYRLVEDGAEDGFYSSWGMGGFDGSFRTAQLGEPADDWRLAGHLTTLLSHGDADYHTFDENLSGFFTGLGREIRREDLSEAVTHFGSPDGSTQGSLLTWPFVTGGEPVGHEIELPGTRRVFMEGDLGWIHQLWVSEPEWSSVIARDLPAEPGATYERTLNTGVFGPALTGYWGGVHRDGDELSGALHLLTDGAGHEGFGAFADASAVLYRDGEEYARSDTEFDTMWPGFVLPAEEAEYRLVTRGSRDPGVYPVSTEVSADFTFRSARTEEITALPVSVVRFTPEVALDSTAPAGVDGFAVPLVIQGAALDNGVDSLAVEVSLDRGASWSAVPVEDGAVAVDNPAAGGSVSLRATLTDGAGNVSVVTVVDAYRTA